MTNINSQHPLYIESKDQLEEYHKALEVLEERSSYLGNTPQVTHAMATLLIHGYLKGHLPSQDSGPVVVQPKVIGDDETFLEELTDSNSEEVTEISDADLVKMQQALPELKKTISKKDISDYLKAFNRTPTQKVQGKSKDQTPVRKTVRELANSLSQRVIQQNVSIDSFKKLRVVWEKQKTMSQRTLDNQFLLSTWEWTKNGGSHPQKNLGAANLVHSTELAMKRKYDNSSEESESVLDSLFFALMHVENIPSQFERLFLNRDFREWFVEKGKRVLDTVDNPPEGQKKKLLAAMHNYLKTIGSQHRSVVLETMVDLYIHAYRGGSIDVEYLKELKNNISKIKIVIKQGTEVTLELKKNLDRRLAMRLNSIHRLEQEINKDAGFVKKGIMRLDHTSQNYLGYNLRQVGAIGSASTVGLGLGGLALQATWEAALNVGGVVATAVTAGAVAYGIYQGCAQETKEVEDEPQSDQNSDKLPGTKGKLADLAESLADTSECTLDGIDYKVETSHNGKHYRNEIQTAGSDTIELRARGPHNNQHTIVRLTRK